MFLWPIVCPLVSSSVVSMDTLLNSACGIPATDQLASSVSGNAASTKRKITGERLLPCVAPPSREILAFSLSIFRITLRLVYNLFIALQSFVWAPNFSSSQVTILGLNHLLLVTTYCRILHSWYKTSSDGVKGKKCSMGFR